MRRDRPLTAVRRTLDPRSINEAANDPDVRPWLGHLEMGGLDLSPLVTDAANVTLANEHGGFLVHRIGDGLYEVHSVFKPEGRGRLRAETARGLWFMFTATDCQKVVTKVPACNPRAAVLAKQSGFVEAFAREDQWDAPDGSRCAVSFQELTLTRWVEIASGLKEAGSALASLTGLGGQDDAALRTLGAASAMLTAGNPAKALWLYGQRAAFACLPPLSLLSTLPPVVGLNGVTIQALAGKLESI